MNESLPCENNYTSDEETGFTTQLYAKELPPFPSKRLREALSFGLLKTKSSEFSVGKNNTSVKTLEKIQNAPSPLKMEIKLSRLSEKNLFELGYYLSVKHLNNNWEEGKELCLYKHIKHLRSLHQYRKPLRDYILGKKWRIHKGIKSAEKNIVIVKNCHSYWYVDKKYLLDPSFRTYSSFNYNSNSPKLHSKMYKTVRKMIVDRKTELTLSNLTENVKSAPNIMSDEEKVNTSLKIETKQPDIVLNKKKTDVKVSNKGTQTDGNYKKGLLGKMEKLLRIHKHLRGQNKLLSENLSCILSDFKIGLVKSDVDGSKINWSTPPELHSTSSQITNLNKLFMRIQ